MSAFDSDDDMHRALRDDTGLQVSYLCSSERKGFWAWLGQEEEATRCLKEDDNTKADTQAQVHPQVPSSTPATKRSAEDVGGAGDESSARKRHQGYASSPRSLSHYLAPKLDDAVVDEARTPSRGESSKPHSVSAHDSPRPPAPDLYMPSNNTPASPSPPTSRDASPFWTSSLPAIPLTAQTYSAPTTTPRSLPPPHGLPGPSALSPPSYPLLYSGVVPLEPETPASTSLLELRSHLARTGDIPLLHMTPSGEMQTSPLPNNATHMLLIAADITAETPCTLVHLNSPTELKNPISKSYLTFRTVLYCWLYGRSNHPLQYLSSCTAWNRVCCGDGPYDDDSRVEIQGYEERDALNAWLAAETEDLGRFER